MSYFTYIRHKINLRIGVKIKEIKYLQFTATFFFASRKRKTYRFLLMNKLLVNVTITVVN